jgi:cytochrome c oxidase cbb3-type subunit 3
MEFLVFRPAQTGMSALHLESRHSCRIVCALLTALCALACHRESRSITASAAEAQRVNPVREGTNQPGAKLLTATALKNPYEGNAYAISQGQRLFEQYNCSGCHFHGGGGIGPPLMDDEWVYGNSPANIYESIAEGRPNGMPSWGGHIPDYQIWQLVTYVRSMANLEPQNATPPRAEEMQPKKAEE